VLLAVPIHSGKMRSASRMWICIRATGKHFIIYTPAPELT
jgi:hypothetical protein